MIRTGQSDTETDLKRRQRSFLEIKTVSLQ